LTEPVAAGDWVQLDFDNTAGSQASSTAWYTGYSVTIPAGTLGADDGVWVRVWMAELNNSGSNRVIQRRWTINGVNYQSADDTQTSSSIYRPDLHELFYTNQASLSAQEYYMNFPPVHNQVLLGTTSINTATTDLTISCAMKWTSSHASAVIYKRGGVTVHMIT